jgi:hypothetical protein
MQCGAPQNRADPEADCAASCVRVSASLLRWKPPTVEGVLPRSRSTSRECDASSTRIVVGMDRGRPARDAGHGGPDLGVREAGVNPARARRCNRGRSAQPATGPNGTGKARSFGRSGSQKTDPPAALRLSGAEGVGQDGCAAGAASRPVASDLPPKPPFPIVRSRSGDVTPSSVLEGSRPPGRDGERPDAALRG